MIGFIFTSESFKKSWKGYFKEVNLQNSNYT